jgi:hypothetical protein
VVTEPVPPDVFRNWIDPHVTAARDFTVTGQTSDP